MTRSRLIKALDSEFRTFIRNRDLKERHTECFICKRFFSPTTLQQGHFVRRGETGLRWSEKNNHMICIECNGPDSINLERYAVAIDKKYGPGTAEYLTIEGKKVAKLMLWEIKEKINYYRNLNNERGKLIDLLV